MGRRRVGGGICLAFGLLVAGCTATGSATPEAPDASSGSNSVAKTTPPRAGAAQSLVALLAGSQCLAWDGITWDPGATGAPVTLSNGNLTAAEPDYFSRSSTRATQFVTSGKWYWEISLDDENPPGYAPESDPLIGVGTADAPILTVPIGGDWRGWAFMPREGQAFAKGSCGPYGTSTGTIQVGDAIGVALDVDGGTLAFFRNGVALGTAFTNVPGGKPLYPMVGARNQFFKTTAHFAPPFVGALPDGFAPLDCAPCGGPDQACCTGGLCDTGSTCSSAGACLPGCAAGTTWDPPSHACVPSCATGITWDPANAGAPLTLSNGNLTVADPNDFQRAATRATQAVSAGKWYWEIDIDDAQPPNAAAWSDPLLGVGTAAAPLVGNIYIGGDANGWGYYPVNQETLHLGVVPYGTSTAAPGVGDVIGVALDVDAGTLAFYKNGVSLGTAFSNVHPGSPLYPMLGAADDYSLATGRFQPPFAYATPAGFKPYGCAAGGGSLDGGVDGGGSDGGDGGDAGDGGEGGEAGAVGCGFEAGAAPSGPPVCGDGWRDPSSEECDDGLGASTARRGCSAQCQVLDELAVAPVLPDGGPVTASRTLGEGRHVVAAGDTTFGVVYLEADATPPRLSLATFGAKGAPSNVTPFSAGSVVVGNSNPVVAVVPCDRYAVAWADFVAEGGDELDVALRLVDPTASQPGPIVHVNTTTIGSQLDPDIVWTGSELHLRVGLQRSPRPRCELSVQAHERVDATILRQRQGVHKRDSDGHGHPGLRRGAQHARRDRDGHGDARAGQPHVEGHPGGRPPRWSDAGRFPRAGTAVGRREASRRLRHRLQHPAA